MIWLVGRTARLIGDSNPIAAALEKHGAALLAEEDCDLLVHVAPEVSFVPMHETDHVAWRTTLDAGLDQRFLAAQQFAAARRAAGQCGSIVFVGAPEQSLGVGHAAATGALVNLTKTLAVEWARDGIRVNTILSNHADDTLGNLVAYLSSDYAAYVTGAVMGITLDDC